MVSLEVFQLRDRASKHQSLQTVKRHTPVSRKNAKIRSRVRGKKHEPTSTCIFKETADGQTIGEVHKSENLALLREMQSQYKGSFDLIYLDPPFKTERDFYTAKDKTKAYSDKFSVHGNSYWDFMRQRLSLMHELLSPSGALYVHTDYRTSAQLKLILLEIFGENNYINEIIWFYKTGGNSNKLGFARKHDTIHFCVKNHKKAIWNQIKEKSYLSHRYGFKNINLKEDEQGVYNLVTMRDVWDIPALRGNHPERVDYPTQKPLLLLERIIQSSSNPGGLVGDFFCGSGTTGVAAKNLNRRYFLADQSAIAIKESIQRLDK